MPQDLCWLVNFGSIITSAMALQNLSVWKKVSIKVAAYNGSEDS